MMKRLFSKMYSTVHWIAFNVLYVCIEYIEALCI